MNKLIMGGVIHLFLFLNVPKIQTSNSPYTHVVDSLFMHVDKSKVKTGILYDRVFPFARLDKFTSKDTTGYDHFRQAYSELYTAHYHAKGHLLSPDDWDDIVDWQRFKKTLPIGVMDMKYNQTKTNALEKHLLIRKGDEFYSNPNTTESPFEERRLQAASLLGSEVEVGLVEVKLVSEALLLNAGQSIEHVDIKIGKDGKKYSLQPGDSVNIDFDHEGLVNVNTSVYYKNGESFSSESAIEVRRSATASMSQGNLPTLSHQPCHKETVTADIPFLGYDEATPIKGQVEVNYFYHYDASDPTGCMQKPIKKPIIVLDGFDPTDKRDATWIYEHNFKYFNPKNEACNFADEQRRAGYDIIIVNMPSYQTGERHIALPNGGEAIVGTLRRAGGDFIEINAMALIKIIQNFNASLAAQHSNEKLIIVGPSMGGLISRYALAYMEKKNMDHNCRLWFSWDATHLGSVLPIGNQYFIESMAGLGLRNVKDIISRQINSPASKQELNHHMLAKSNEPEGAPAFKDRFYEGMDTMGWPQKTRKIAMISGAINGASQSGGKAGGTAMDFKLKMNDVPRLLLFNVVGLFASPNFINATVSFSPSEQMGKSEVLRMKVLGIPQEKRYAEPFANSRNSMDLIQGGWYPGFQEIRDSTRDKLKGFFKWVADPRFANVVDNHCHQPSANTLAIGQGPFPNPERKWDDDLTKVAFNCGEEKEIPWDAYYAPEVNLRHDSLTYEYAWRMRDEMDGIPMPQPKTKRDVTIEGSTAVMNANETRTYKIPTANKQTVYNWSVSNPNIQIVSGQGTPEITVKYMGGSNNISDINCTATSKCYMYKINGITLKDTSTSPQMLYTTASLVDGDE